MFPSGHRAGHRGVDSLTRQIGHQVWVVSADTAKMSPSDVAHRVRAALPSGVRLPVAEWEQRHRWIIRLVWLHVPIIIVYGFATGNGVLHNLAEATPTAVLGFLGSRTRLDRRSRAMLTGLGLI